MSVERASETEMIASCGSIYTEAKRECPNETDHFTDGNISGWILYNKRAEPTCKFGESDSYTFYIFVANHLKHLDMQDVEVKVNIDQANIGGNLVKGYWNDALKLQAGDMGDDTWRVVYKTLKHCGFIFKANRYILSRNSRYYKKNEDFIENLGFSVGYAIDYANLQNVSGTVTVSPKADF